MKRITTLSLIVLTLLVGVGCKPRIKIRPKPARPSASKWIVNHAARRAATNEIRKRVQEERERQRLEQRRLARQRMVRRGQWGR